MVCSKPRLLLCTAYVEGTGTGPSKKGGTLQSPDPQRITGRLVPVSDTKPLRLLLQSLESQ